MADALEGGLPHAVALTWGVAEMPQRGPKRELSIERIVDAAIEIADTEGLAGVSMSRVATSLGFTTMSLYRYVTSKDDLLLLMQDTACAVAIPPATDSPPWREGLREWVRLTMGVYRDHPWFGDVPVSSVPMTPNNLLLIDWGLRIMQSVPLTGQEKMSALLLLSSYTRVFGGFERDIDRAVRQGSAPGGVAAEALKELVTAARFPHLYPLVQSGEYADDETAGTERFDDFAFGIERILDGIQAHIDATAGGAATEAPAKEATAPSGPDVTRDKGVREAAKARREVEVKLREALKREKEAVGRARERAAKAG
ncbi:TetR/AcrR family transcriptional regulator [Leifsonia sp. Root112D2]|uniref:TetR/AcrR family transcriptional regulator n=1 Tax=Leifsonia sp. Root112D2 TaxID=1736426 RepID=UPI0007010045|nr:TetR/AcrR family transcriptional regulator [Leifsonia sp. Root112D2]KQV05240.1 TetR family transcriptional regulator [Leifsonia sp. Root112D2]